MDSKHKKSAAGKASGRRQFRIASLPCSSSNRLLSGIIAAFYLIGTVLHSPVTAGAPFITIIRPNFTASYHEFIDTSGAFLASEDGSFEARITNPNDTETFYLVVAHVSSNTIVWTANRNSAISGASELRLTTDGFSLHDTAGYTVWSASNLSSVVSALRLLTTGNLVLLDAAKNSLWESFDYPTDVLLAGQNLRRGRFLVSSVSSEDLSEGIYRLTVGDDDATLTWKGLNYWVLSTDTNAFRLTNFRVEYLAMNSSGVYLMGSTVEQTVIELHFNVPATFSGIQIVKLEATGALTIVSRNSTATAQLFSAPTDPCRLPMICGRAGICTSDTKGGSCVCDTEFTPDQETASGAGCVPKDASLALPSPCNGSSGDANVEYLNMTNVSLNGNVRTSVREIVLVLAYSTERIMAIASP
ncbi:G-type lectin S-receptor-like serine/threonine-protein kinase At5g35370 [Andrographis paniculata]|uniref:G-type lectin S-receptor-like serine/threonine-protein kinase At5g35370 n=1 Tax=Andrographis paniculata TaxID=175694 RepID=UPI0021E94A2E|nr:G-type lectin S-receptor-like serine/threonine-protein kinase At5g35370 [Andrographis paniculata]